MQWMAAICAPAPLALTNQLPLPTILYSAAGRGIGAVSSAIEESDLCLLPFTTVTGDQVTLEQ